MYANDGTDSTYDIMGITPGNYSGPTLAAELNNLFDGMPGSYYIYATLMLVLISYQYAQTAIRQGSKYTQIFN